jgi:hypothetical protein
MNCGAVGVTGGRQKVRAAEGEDGARRLRYGCCLSSCLKAAFDSRCLNRRLRCLKVI